MLAQKIRVDYAIHEPEYEATDIFKFGLFKDLKRTLENCTLGFSLLSNFNDPFEVKFQYRHFYRSIEEQYASFELSSGIYNNSNEVNIVELIQSQLSTYRVSCFSQIPHEPLMWAHYADKHQGICYCFNKDNIFPQPEYKKGLVNYSTIVPLLDYFEGYSTEELLKPQLENVILTKSDNWTYEKELRYYTQTDENIHSFNPQSLQAVIIGSRAIENKDYVEDQIKSYNEKHETNVLILFSHPKRDSFSMQIGYNSIEQTPSRQSPIYDPDSPIL